MRLADAIGSARGRRRILVMTHVVIGYPDRATSAALVDAMVEAGADLIELQIPFSEPIADGPVLLGANEAALRTGITVADCFGFAEAMTKRHAIPFLFTSYYNVLFRQGLDRFAARAAAAGVTGAVVPDCPLEEADDYRASMDRNGLAPVFMISPRTSPARMAKLGEASRGFVYVSARRGVTGSATEFSAPLAGYLAQCRAATSRPLAVGFGLTRPKEIAYLADKAEIAVVGTELVRVFAREGVAGVKAFVAALSAQAALSR